jgi:hypothetical protein
VDDDAEMKAFCGTTQGQKRDEKGMEANVPQRAVASPRRVVAPFDRRILKGTTILVVIASACLVSVTKIAASGREGSDGQAWRVGVTRVCADALLFESRHSIGTEQGAVAVASDIRASTARRLVRIGALRARPERPLLASQWLQVEQRLSELFASSYLRIWHAIAQANSPTERAQLPRILEQLLHRPDRAREQARLLEEQLHVPDCTGGENTTPTPSIVFDP